MCSTLFYCLSFLFSHTLFGYIGDQVLDYYSDFIAEKLPNQWGGFFLSSNQPIFPGMDGSIMYSMVHFGPWEEGWPVIEPLYNFHPEWTILRTAANYSTFWEYQKLVDDGLTPSRNYIGIVFKITYIFKINVMTGHKKVVSNRCCSILVSASYHVSSLP